MYNPQPPTGAPRPEDDRRRLGPRDRARSLWLVLAVLVGVIVITLAVGLDRSTGVDDATGTSTDPDPVIAPESAEPLLDGDAALPTPVP